MNIYFFRRFLLANLLRFFLQVFAQTAWRWSWRANSRRMTLLRMHLWMKTLLFSLAFGCGIGII